MQITVKYYAALAELANTTREQLEIDDNSLSVLYQRLKQKYSFPYEFSQVRVAINAQYVPEDTALQPNDTVLFITPVAGG